MFGYIQGCNLFPEPLNIEDEKIYLLKMKEGDKDARKILIERNLRLVAHIAKKYQSTNIDQDDLISIGTMGLIKGIDSFKLDKNYIVNEKEFVCLIEKATDDIFPYVPLFEEDLMYEYKLTLN